MTNFSTSNPRTVKEFHKTRWEAYEERQKHLNLTTKPHKPSRNTPKSKSSRRFTKSRLGWDMELVAGRSVGDGDLDRGPARRSSAFVIVALLNQHAAGPHLALDLVVHVDRKRHRRVLI